MSQAPPPILEARRAPGEEIEGWAFTFCKAALIALIFQKFTPIATSGLAVMLYIVAAAYGVREWRCFIKPPWVVVGLAAMCAAQSYVMFFRR
jgi:hypothetical protein